MRGGRGGHTLIELMVASGVLLLMVFMTTTAVVSYIHAYHQYTEKGLRVRQAAKVLEVVCQHLRSADTLPKLEEPLDCAKKPLVFGERNAGPRAIVLDAGVLELQELDLEGKVKAKTRIGKSKDLTFTQAGRRLHLTLQVDESQPLETEISLRGVVQE